MPACKAALEVPRAGRCLRGGVKGGGAGKVDEGEGKVELHIAESGVGRARSRRRAETKKGPAMPAPFRCAMIGRRSEADAELDAHRTRLLEARDPAIIGTRGARVSRAGIGEVELRILIEYVAHGDVQRAVERVGRPAESDAESELGHPGDRR